MKLYKYRIYLLSFLLIANFSACNKKVKSSNSTYEKLELELALENICNKLSTLSKNGRPIRLAVVPFYSSFENPKNENKFGNYFAERSITKVKNVEHNIKLFERKRLDAITKEHALNLSGLIKEADAVKIGELIPIDFLLTGTYTKLDSSIDINGRVLDVVTGEIVQTFILQIELTNDLSSLFSTSKQTPSVSSTLNNGKDSKPACDSDFIALKKLLKAETNKKSHLEKITNIALNIPVNIECGKYHKYYINYLCKQNIFSKVYQDYLYKEALNYSENPDIGPLISSILKYFHDDNVIDTKDWKLGLSILKKSSDITSSYFVKYLFVKPTKSNINVQKKRIDQLVKLINSKKVLTGEPTSSSKGFYHIFTELEVNNNISELQLYLLNKHSKMIQDKRYGQEMYKKLVILFKKEDKLKNRLALLNWMSYLSKYDNEHGSNAFSLFHILEDLSKNSGNSLQDSVILESFKVKMMPSMKRLFTCCLNNSRSQNLCIKNGIHIEGLTPSISELKQKLANENIKIKSEAAKLIEAYGINARPIEKDIARILRQSAKMTDRDAMLIEKHLLQILKNTKTSDMKIIQNIFEKFSSTRYNIPQTAMEVMETLGAPSFKVMTSNFNNSNISVKIRIIKTLAKMTEQKKEAITFIKHKIKTTKNDSVKNALEDSLIRMGAL